MAEICVTHIKFMYLSMTEPKEDSLVLNVTIQHVCIHHREVFQQTFKADEEKENKKSILSSKCFYLLERNGPSRYIRPWNLFLESGYIPLLSI